MTEFTRDRSVLDGMTKRIATIALAAIALTAGPAAAQAPNLDDFKLRQTKLDRLSGDKHLRWSFNDITPDAFVWRGEHSTDGGASFRLVEEMRLRRA
jgi:hypothetical protein